MAIISSTFHDYYDFQTIEKRINYIDKDETEISIAANHFHHQQQYQEYSENSNKIFSTNICNQNSHHHELITEFGHRHHYDDDDRIKRNYHKRCRSKSQSNDVDNRDDYNQNKISIAELNHVDNNNNNRKTNKRNAIYFHAQRSISLEQQFQANTLSIDRQFPGFESIDNVKIRRRLFSFHQRNAFVLDSLNSLSTKQNESSNRIQNHDLMITRTSSFNTIDNNNNNKNQDKLLTENFNDNNSEKLRQHPNNVKTIPFQRQTSFDDDDDKIKDCFHQHLENSIQIPIKEPLIHHIPNHQVHHRSHSLYQHQQQQQKRNNPFDNNHYNDNSINYLENDESLNPDRLNKLSNKSVNSLKHENDSYHSFIDKDIQNFIIKSSNENIVKEVKHNILDWYGYEKKHFNFYYKKIIVNENDCIVRILSRPQRQPTSKQTLKLIMIGDSTVGKTSLINRIRTGIFQSDPCPTIGIDFQTVQAKVDNEYYDLQLWDTAGQERYHSITRNYYRHVHAICMVFDVSKEQTFLNVRNWLTSIEDTVSKPIPLLLIGNKCDLRYTNNDGQFKFLSRQSGRRLADEIGPNCVFIETSCKTGFNVDNIMIIATKMIIAEQNRKNYKKINDGLKVANKSNYTKNCC